VRGECPKTVANSPATKTAAVTIGDIGDFKQHGRSNAPKSRIKRWRMNLGKLTTDDRIYLEGLLDALEKAPVKLVQMQLPEASPYSEITRGMEMAVTGLRSLLR